MTFLSPWSEMPLIATLPHRGRTAMEKYQDRKLVQLINDVYSANPFYRNLWDDHGFHPGNFRGCQDLHLLPTITKQQARVLSSQTQKNPPAAGRLVRHSTSGSSGEPFTLVRSWHEERFLAVVRMAIFQRSGFHAWYRRAMIRVPADFDWLDDRPLRILNKLGLYRLRVFSCFETPESLWKQISAYAPDTLGGYSETVARVARYGLEAGLRDIRPKHIVVGGELCTPLMSRQISAAFQAPVFQGYSSTEFGVIARTCPQSGLLHICDPAVLVEVLDGDGQPVADGESGTVVATALHLRVMPFVRFVLGDRVVKGPAPCPCGAPYATLRSIDGREIDCLRLSDGGTLHAYEMLNALLGSDNRWIRQYQIVQDEPGFIEVHIWPLRAPDPAALEHLKSVLEERTHGTPVRMKLVESMELDRNGKFHLCRSSVR